MAVVKGMSRRGEINLEKIDDRMFNIFAPVEVDSYMVRGPLLRYVDCGL